MLLLEYEMPFFVNLNAGLADHVLIQFAKHEKNYVLTLSITALPSPFEVLNWVLELHITNILRNTDRIHSDNALMFANTFHQ